MTSKHTPGPWKAYKGTEGYGVVGICGGYYGDIANEADANLIAAAPELLDVAQSILADDMLQYLPAEYVAKVRSVITKAMQGDEW